MSISRRHALRALALSSTVPFWSAMPGRTAQNGTPAARRLDAGGFGLVADAGDDGSGTDNSAALRAFFVELASGRYDEGVIPKGRYAVAQPVELRLIGADSIALLAEGAELVFTLPTPQKGRGYLTISHPVNFGGSLRLEGLTARLARPAIRTSDSDMIRIGGFRNYSIEGIAIPSSDNMGLTIGRPGSKTDRPTPDRILVRDCQIGGRREAAPHSHGSIGDTGIWIIAPAVETDILNCTVRETGDDGIYVGHSGSPTIRRTTIRDNIIRDSGARGIGIAVPGGDIVGNRIDRTNCAGIICEYQDGGAATGVVIARNQIQRAGQLEAGDIAAGMIGKNNAHGIFIHMPNGPVRIVGNDISQTRDGGIGMVSHRVGGLSGVEIQGGTFRAIGTDRGGVVRPDRISAVIRREGNLPTTVADVSVTDIQVITSTTRLVDWEATGLISDSNIAIERAAFIDCTLPAGMALARVRQKLTGGVANMRLSCNIRRSPALSQGQLRVDGPTGINVMASD